MFELERNQQSIGSIGRITLEERLKKEKKTLEERLEKINAALSQIESNPAIATFMESLQQVI